MRSLLLKLKVAVSKFDPLNLGNSFVIYFLASLLTLPILIFFIPQSSEIAPLLKTSPLDFSIYYYSFVVLGFLMFLFGLKYTKLNGSASKIRGIWNYEWQSRRTLVVFMAVFTFGLLIKVIRIYNGGFFYLHRDPAFTGSALYSLIGLFDWTGIIALFIALIAYFHFAKTHDNNFAIWRYLVWLPLAVEVSGGFLSRARGTVIVPLVAYVIVRYFYFKKSQGFVLASFIFIFFILMPLLNINRSPEVFLNAYNIVKKEEILAASSAILKSNPIKLVTMATNPSKAIALVLHIDAGRITSLQHYIFDSSVMRVDQSRLLLAVINNAYQFSFGDSLIKFAISLGPPRFIWKNKPIIQGSIVEIARRGGALSAKETTSVGPTIVGDWYLNFGIWGIVFGMFFTSLLFNFLSQAFISGGEVHPTGLIIFGVTWLHTIPQSIEGWMAPLWAGYVKLFVILFVVHLALKGRRFAKH